MVNSQTQKLLDELYSETLSRTYVNTGGYRIMPSRAYGSAQRGALQAHKPGVCYPAQGFMLHRTEASRLATPFGEIPAQRLFTSGGPREEPVTHWFTVGDKPVHGKLQKRLVDLRYGPSGRIPEGLLFRSRVRYASFSQREKKRAAISSAAHNSRTASTSTPISRPIEKAYTAISSLSVPPLGPSAMRYVQTAACKGVNALSESASVR